MPSCTRPWSNAVQVLVTLITIALVAPVQAQVFTDKKPAHEHAAPVRGGLGGGGALQDNRIDSIPDIARARIRRSIERFERDHPWLAAPAVHATNRGFFGPMDFPFYPHAGNPNADLYNSYFVDLDPGPGLLDFACGDRTYDGHQGNDTDLRSFAEQAIGVPVFAALAGVVVDADDGHFDMSTSWDNPGPANFVVLNHSPGEYTLYWHLKNGSVDVEIGEAVAAWQQIGLTGSSGFSTGPHLHFEIWNGNAFTEPYAGPCRPGGSLWANQPSIRHDLYLRDFGFARGTLDDLFQGPPHAYPRSNHLYNTFFPDRYTASYWMQGHNLPAGSTWRIRFVDPMGIVEFDSGTNTFAWSTEDLDWWWSWWSYDIPAMQWTPGEWRVEISINGSVVVEAPVEVSFDEQPQFNRPPEPVAAAFDPPRPMQREAVFCRIETDLVHDDPDFDVLSYRYRWTVNGQVGRDVTTAAHSDALAADLVTGDATLACSVTPSDGRLSAPPASVSAWVEGFPCNTADLRTPFGTLDLGDIAAFVNGFNEPFTFADLNDDGRYDLDDIVVFVTAFTAGCP